jgi:hypothetical protein
LPRTTTDFECPAKQTNKLPKSGFALEIDGRLKAEFSTKEGAEHGAIELKRRFPMLETDVTQVTASVRRRVLYAPNNSLK